MSVSEILTKYVKQAQVSSIFIDLMGLISVKSYGAIGDHITDDTDAVILAIEAVVENDLKSLYFPHGSYKVDPDRINNSDFADIFCWGDNSEFFGITHPINQVGTNLSMITSFLGLEDTPATYGGAKFKHLSVNEAETALELVAAYTKDEIDDILATYYTAVQVTQFMSGYYTGSQVDSALANYCTAAQVVIMLASYYNESEIASILTGYYTTAQINALIANYYTAAQVNSLFSGYSTAAQINSMLASYYTASQVDNFAVKLSGNQTVGGVKTFDYSPIVPTPTTNYQAATFKLVEDAKAVVINQRNDTELKTWVGSSAQYAAIGIKDSFTLYYTTA